MKLKCSVSRDMKRQLANWLASRLAGWLASRLASTPVSWQGNRQGWITYKVQHLEPLSWKVNWVCEYTRD